MSALWTLSRGIDRLCGVLLAGLGTPGRGSAVPWPAGPPFRFLCRGSEVMVQHRLRVSARSRPGPACTARGWGGTGQGLCVLHEPWPFVEYTRPSFSSTPPSCSTRRTSPEHQARPLSGTTTGYSLPQTARPPLPQMPRAPQPSQSMRPRRRSALGDARRPPTFRVALYFSHITARKIRVGHRGERGKEILEIAWRRGRQGVRPAG